MQHGRLQLPFGGDYWSDHNRGDWHIDHITAPRKSADLSKRTRAPVNEQATPRPEPADLTVKYRSIVQRSTNRYHCQFEYNAERHYVKGAFKTPYAAAYAHDVYCHERGIARMSLTSPGVCCTEWEPT